MHIPIPPRRCLCGRVPPPPASPGPQPGPAPRGAQASRTLTSYPLLPFAAKQQLRPGRPRTFPDTLGPVRPRISAPGPPRGTAAGVVLPACLPGRREPGPGGGRVSPPAARSAPGPARPPPQYLLPLPAGPAPPAAARHAAPPTRGSELAACFRRQEPPAETQPARERLLWGRPRPFRHHGPAPSAPPLTVATPLPTRWPRPLLWGPRREAARWVRPGPSPRCVSQVDLRSTGLSSPPLRLRHRGRGVMGGAGEADRWGRGGGGGSAPGRGHRVPEPVRPSSRAASPPALLRALPASSSVPGASRLGLQGAASCQVSPRPSVLRLLPGRGVCPERPSPFNPPCGAYRPRSLAWRAGGLRGAVPGRRAFALPVPERVPCGRLGRTVGAPAARCAGSQARRREAAPRFLPPRRGRRSPAAP